MKVIQKENVALAGLVGTTLLAGGLLTIPGVVAGTDAVDEITITVPPSCSLSSTGGDSHTAEILNGQTNSSVGESTIKAYCNDNNGFSIYVIGYTDNELGKTVLTSSTLGSTHDILTGTNTTGNSSWAMKLSTITSPEPTYPLIIAGSVDDTDKEQGDPDYTSFQEVPDDYTLVAKRTSSTDTGENAEGATLKTTYQVHISNTQSAGTYTGQVKYTMVHPYNGVAPKKLVAMQNWSGCTSMSTGDTITLTDTRDGAEYLVGKLADGNCWMLDNLALDPTDATTAQNMNETNTNASAEAINNLLHGGSTTTGWSNTAVANVTSNFSDGGDTVPRINNQSKNTTVTSYGAGNGKVGVYYNYCAASASTYCYAEGQGVDIPDTIIDAPQDICPAGWRMPTGGNTGEYYALAQKYGNNTSNTNSLQYNLSTPLSGYLYGSSASEQGSNGYWWFSTYFDSYGMYSLYVSPTYVNPNYYNGRHGGLPMRCLVGE